jgi:hypothetical protein
MAEQMNSTDINKAANEVDDKQKRIEQELTLREHQLKVQSIANDLKSQELILQKRHEYADGLYRLVFIWLLVIVAFLLMDGFSLILKDHKFVLSDTVILALIGGTTITVLGLFTIVATYFFPSANKSSKTS